MLAVSGVLTEFSIDVNKAAATYDLCTAANDLIVCAQYIYVSTAGVAPLVSVSIQTNQTTALTLMTAAEGAVANLTAQSHPNAICNTFLQPWTLRSGQKVQYTITGASGTGVLRVGFLWQPVAGGAYLY